MDFSGSALKAFQLSTRLYHQTDDIDTPMPFSQDDNISSLLSRKNWIDAVQWHLEDIIRDPDIEPAKALELKRRIDRSNQDRTDLVERIDDFFLDLFKDVKPLPDATINTESPAWAIDRLSILVLKIWHMEEETRRTDTTPEHIARCKDKLEILLEQREDLAQAIDTLLEDMKQGHKYMKVYRQMKMYNDEETNPVLRKNRDK